MVQWLRFHTSTVRGTGSVLSQGTKILHAAWPGNKEEKKREQERKMVREAQFNIDLLNSYQVPDPGQDAGNTNTVMIISVSEELPVKFQKKATFVRCLM